MKIGIVGTGAVGSTAAYAMLIQGIASELVLVDSNLALAVAHREDLLHATPFSFPIHMQSGDFPLLDGCSIVIIAAGVAQVRDETRMQLLERNAAVFAQIVSEIMRYAPGAILLVATNPLDVMTQVATNLSGLSPDRVIGSGTMLDTARFQSLLATRLKISPSSVHAYVLGEHGDSEVLIWSSASVAGIPLIECAALCGYKLDDSEIVAVDQAVRKAAYKIITGKGATYYGIGAALAFLARAILQDECRVVSASAVAPSFSDVCDVAMSLPVVIGKHGVQQRLEPALNTTEHEALKGSAALIKNSVNQAMLSIKQGN
ncbi:L-lactate dehydrogenase [Pseudoduganella sp. RAF53_2]|uniref:L-lactate dehydrogenase n=1 Tax=unclassified Pseudoduganella TaxID=2637179 RepID=UPI003F962BA9